MGLPLIHLPVVWFYFRMQIWLDVNALPKSFPMSVKACGKLYVNLAHIKLLTLILRTVVYVRAYMCTSMHTHIVEYGFVK